MSQDLQISRERGSLFFVIRNDESVPLAFSNLVTMQGITRQIVRIAGGCGGISSEIVAGLPQYFLDGFKDYTGVAFSGGTGDFGQDGELDGFMVTNVPGILAKHYRCLAISTTPRTADMSLEPTHGGVIMNDYGNRIDHHQHAAVVVQANASDVLDWDGDLNIYLTLMQGYQQQGFAAAVIALNGGGVTKKEIYQSLSRGIPVIAVEGSMRETDQFITDFRNGEAVYFDESTGEDTLVKPELVTIVPIGDGPALRTALVQRGIIVVS